MSQASPQAEPLFFFVLCGEGGGGNGQEEDQQRGRWAEQSQKRLYFSALINYSHGNADAR